MNTQNDKAQDNGHKTAERIAKAVNDDETLALIDAFDKWLNTISKDNLTMNKELIIAKYCIIKHNNRWKDNKHAIIEINKLWGVSE